MGIPATWNEFRTIECYLCGTGFAVEATLYNARLRDQRSFWCPNGHQQHFTGTTPEARKIRELEAERDRLKRERDAATTARSWAESRAKGANIAAGLAKAAKKRLEQRVSRGVCPCCHRTFKQLAAHMKTKHPDVVG